MPLFSNEDIDRVKKIDEVKNITSVKLLFTDDIKFQNGKTSVSNTIHCLEEKYLKNLNIRIAEGKFPEKDNEILIGDSVHKATSMNVGDTVTIKTVSYTHLDAPSLPLACALYEVLSKAKFKA